MAAHLSPPAAAPTADAAAAEASRRTTRRAACPALRHRSASLSVVRERPHRATNAGSPAARGSPHAKPACRYQSKTRASNTQATAASVRLIARSVPGPSSPRTSRSPLSHERRRLFAAERLARHTLDSGRRRMDSQPALALALGDARKRQPPAPHAREAPQEDEATATAAAARVRAHAGLRRGPARPAPARRAAAARAARASWHARRRRAARARRQQERG